MTKLGAFTFVLHSHLPYARMAGRWPHGEEWLHEAAAETYIPLLDAMNRLLGDGVPLKLTLSLTPILLEQLADDLVKENFLAYLALKIEAAEGDIARFRGSDQRHLLFLAEYYRDWYVRIRRSFVDAYQKDLVGAFRRLQDQGALAVITCAATHGYLPLLKRDGSIQLQLRTAVQAYQRHFGRLPKGIWLPECAYRPAYQDPEGKVRNGLESFLAAHGLKLFFTETHMIEGGRPVGVAAGEAIGPYGAITRRYRVPFSDHEPAHPATTYLPYYVADSDVAVVGRDNTTGLQVWSADWGYPGDFDYREFHKKDGVSGLQYWRVTGSRIDLAQKDLYHPDWAEFKVGQHADHFVHLLSKRVEDLQATTGKFGLVSANFDTELFGHWWFEGVDWLEAVLRRVADSETVELTTALDFIEGHPPESAIHLPEGSWGAGGTHFVWDNAETGWMWPIIHAAEERMAGACREYAGVKGGRRYQLDQAARELLLLQSSDWPFLVTTGQAREYAVQRFLQHVERFNDLLDAVERSEQDDLVDRFWELDKVFPDIDFNWFEG